MLSADDPSEMLAIISITAPDTTATVTHVRTRFNASLKSMASTPSSAQDTMKTIIAYPAVSCSRLIVLMIARWFLLLAYDSALQA